MVMRPSRGICAFPMPYWQCRSCGDEVPRLLPNGQRNQVHILQKDAVVPWAVSLFSAQDLERSFTICLSCSDAWQELLGSLVVPEWQQGTVFALPGVAGTKMILALTIPEDSEETVLWIGSFTAHGQPHIEEHCPLSLFDGERLTYPGERGTIDPVLWEHYQAWLGILQGRYPQDGEQVG